MRTFTDWLKGKPKAPRSRSGKWKRIRKEHLAASPACAVCGSVKKVEAHHKIPFHIDPSKELEPTNIITLCEKGPGKINCHLVVGHLGNYKLANPRVAADAESLHAMFSQRIKQ